MGHGNTTDIASRVQGRPSPFSGSTAGVPGPMRVCACVCACVRVCDLSVLPTPGWGPGGENLAIVWLLVCRETSGRASSVVRPTMLHQSWMFHGFQIQTTSQPRLEADLPREGNAAEPGPCHNGSEPGPQSQRLFEIAEEGHGRPRDSQIRSGRGEWAWESWTARLRDSIPKAMGSLLIVTTRDRAQELIARPWHQFERLGFMTLGQLRRARLPGTPCHLAAEARGDDQAASPASLSLSRWQRARQVSGKSEMRWLRVTGAAAGVEPEALAAHEAHANMSLGAHDWRSPLAARSPSPKCLRVWCGP